MRLATRRAVAISCLVSFVVVGCTDEMSGSGDPLLAPAGQDTGGLASGPQAQSAPAPGPSSAQIGLAPGLAVNAGSAGMGPAMSASASPAGASAAAGTAAPSVASVAGAAATAGSAGLGGIAAAGGSGSQAGAAGDAVSSAGAAAGAGGAAGAGAVAGAGAMNVCPMPLRIPAAQSGSSATPLPVQVDDGEPVNGAGCVQQWEGIVMTKGGRGLCTAAFISDRHLISASHCYASDGSVSVDVSAPTWENGSDHTFQAQVTRSGSNMSLDISIIDLGEPVPWATPERRFVLHAGQVPASVELHPYGFGDGGSGGAAGTLRGIPNRATITVTDDGNGNLSGKAGEARLCSGDSGGPAFVEDTAAVLYGINQAIVPSGWGRSGGVGSCAGPEWTIMFTNISDYMDFIEDAVGTPCERKQVDGMDVAQCW